MRHIHRATTSICAALMLAMAGPAAASDGWRTLSAPAPLPAADMEGNVEVNGANLHFKIFGAENSSIVLLLHGGMGAAEDFGSQIDALAAEHRLVTIDSRGHGRSTDDGGPLSYEQLAADVIGVMDSLDIERAAIVGWSDGGNIGLQLAITHPERLTKVFALGANYNTSAARPSVQTDALIGAFVGHAGALYNEISPTPDQFEAFAGRLFALWGSQPNFEEDQLRAITVPFMVAAGVYEEAIDEAHTKRMAELIPGAELFLIGNSSHFAHWQQPEVVNEAILAFLAAE